MRSALASADIGELETHASTALRSFRESGQAVVFTRNGVPAAVLITPEEYTRLHDQERFLSVLDQGMADSEADRVIENDEVWRELDTEFGPLPGP